MINISYMHIENLYKNNEILLFKKCYAMEKIHGTSAHISYNPEGQQLHFSPGGEPLANFMKLFDEEKIKEKFISSNLPESTVIFGEAYGGKCQGMSDTYGKELKFIVFEVKIGKNWLSVPQAEAFAKTMELEFVHYDEVETDIDLLNNLCGADSVQAIRNGCGEGHVREGIVLRPLIEVTTNKGDRIIAKHKNEKFAERMKQPKASKGFSELEILTKAYDIANEWVTEMRLSHVLDKFPNAEMKDIPMIINAMIEDINREAKGEIEESKKVNAAIGKRTAELFKHRIKMVKI